MADDIDWAGRGFTRPGPQGEDDGRDPQSADGWTPDTSQGFPPGAAYEIGRTLAARSQREPCPLHLWGGPGHSQPLQLAHGRVCPGDLEREAGG